MDQNSRSIKFGVDLIRDESKVPSSEQQGQFLAHVAATPSPMCLVHTSARHAQQLKWLCQTVNTSDGSKQTSYSQQVENDHEKRLEEGQPSKDVL